MEGVRADVQFVAEALGGTRAELKAELQQFRKEVAEEFTELRSMIRLSLLHHHLRQLRRP